MCAYRCADVFSFPSDKTTLSYAAIFGIREDLKLKKTEYSWLSSIFYFGWLAWAFPANVLMQKVCSARISLPSHDL